MGDYLGDLQDAAFEAWLDQAEREWFEESYYVAVFVEGPGDIMFFRTVASKLKQAGYLKADFDDTQIGFLPFGGDLLGHWIRSEAIQKLTRRFGVVVDSDRKSPRHSIPGRKLQWKQACEKVGGRFFILRKRESENYLHPDAIARAGHKLAPYDDFTDMKATFGSNIIKVIGEMSAEEILERDRYEEDGFSHHELKEIVEAFLALPSSWP
ncbi:MAG: hypothetical protein U9R15_07845 [Chloroflexota bacterium]|nr:hypothetical protein [Chloroflexota bacterium]